MMKSAGARTIPAGRQSVERRPTLTAIDGTERDARASTADAVVAAAVAGDARARSELVHAYLRKAMAIAIEYMPTREDAEDVVQDAFRSAFTNLHRFDQRRPFGPWFFTIVRNTARNAIDRRRVRAHESISPAIATNDVTPLEHARRRELRTAIEQAIETLPPAQQTAFRLCIVEGLTRVEAASATGVAESTVRVHIFKARRALQELLERWRDEVE